MRPIIRGTELNSLLLQPAIVDVIADDNRRYVHGQADKYVNHTLTPPFVWRAPPEGVALAKLYQKKFDRSTFDKSLSV